MSRKLTSTSIYADAKIPEISQWVPKYRHLDNAEYRFIDTTMQRLFNSHGPVVAAALVEDGYRRMRKRHQRVECLIQLMTCETQDGNGKSWPAILSGGCDDRKAYPCTHVQAHVEALGKRMTFPFVKSRLLLDKVSDVIIGRHQATALLLIKHLLSLMSSIILTEQEAWQVPKKITCTL